MSQKISHLESLCVIHIDFDIWSGQTRLKASDLKLGDGGELPPEKVAQLGSKKTCDPAKLKGFHRLKTEARRMLLRVGLPFMNGFAIPNSKIDQVTRELDDISLQYEQLKQDFINEYDSAVEEWVRENPDFEDAIRAGALPRASVEKRIGFDYQVFMIQPIEDEATASRLDGKVEALGDDLISEIVEEAEKFYKERLAGRSKVAVTTRLTLAKLRDKVDGLSFLNSAFTPVVQLLDQTIQGYTQHAAGRNVIAPFFYQVVAATLILSDRQRIMSYANQEITVDSMTQNVLLDEAPLGSVPDQSADSTGVSTAQQSTVASDQSSDASSAGTDQIDASAVTAPTDGQVAVSADPGSEAAAQSSELDMTGNDLDDFFANYGSPDSHVAEAESASTVDVQSGQVESSSQAIAEDEVDSSPKPEVTVESTSVGSAEEPVADTMAPEHESDLSMDQKPVEMPPETEGGDCFF